MKYAAAPGGLTSHPSHPLDPPLCYLILLFYVQHDIKLLTVGYPSVRPSVPSIDSMQPRRPAGLLLSALRARYIDLQVRRVRWR